MQKSEVTIHDISKALGIDSSTVSRALNDSPRVSSKTKAKILAKATELGYRRNSLASNLRTNKTYTIGVVVPRISRNFFSNVISGIEETAYENGYNVIICQSLESLDREQKIMNTLLSNRVDGVLISISMETTSFKHLEPFKNYGTPIVFYDRPCNYGGCTSVSINDFEASFMATEHLIFNGCKRIVHFGGPQHIELYQNRKKGYISALEKHGLEFDKTLFLETKLTEEDGVKLAKKVINIKGGVDGIYAANDTSAISAMRYFKLNGVIIPDEISIVGFNNDPISVVIEPSLTTVNQPDFEMGQIAAKALIDQIKEKKCKTKALVLGSDLIVRGSSSKIRLS